jgi:dimethylhistidine N-methyltransferase
VARLLQHGRHLSHAKEYDMRPRARAVAVGDSAAPSLADCRRDILAGLTAAQKRLAPKYLYDEIGSRLFDEICSLPEYYATRTEVSLLRTHAAAIAALVGPRASIVELGAGSSLKARLLLGSLEEPESYVPVDVSADYLAQQAAEIADSFPNVAVHPVVADFTRPFALPGSFVPERTLVFFPGSTIGNLSRMRAATLLASLAERLRGSALLIGVDVCKDPDVLKAAYNDSRGVTAAFNLNLLARLDRELGATFDLAAFEHDAVYDPVHARIEMRLVSKRAQAVTVAGTVIQFREGEYIVSEHSHKYAPDEFAGMARAAGWRVERCWIDDAARFSVHYFHSR